MLGFPVTIMDNFFDDPNSVREFALRQNYQKDPNHRWPGKRTQFIDKLNPDLFKHFTRRFFSLYYDFEFTNIDWLVNSYFQKIDSTYRSGWVHPDRHSILSGIIYLNPDAPISAGTSIFYRKKENPFCEDIHRDKKEASYAKNISPEEVEKYRIENNKQYEESIRISNVYNRLIAFDSHQLHSANDFFGKEDDNTERLTLVFFVENVGSSGLPIPRAKQY